MNKSFSFWQFSGLVFTGILGTILHFVFDWTNQSVISALFCAVNESIWEHMKLLYFPMFAFSLIQADKFKYLYSNFWCIKLSGLLIGLVTIPTIYYTYTGILGISADWFNILIFFISAAISFYVETILIKNCRRCIFSSTVSLIIILLIGIVFIIFTFSPPKIPLFQDPINKTFGYIYK